jgi:hypothetical protein
MFRPRIAEVHECKECVFFDSGHHSSREHYQRNPIPYGLESGYCHHETQMCNGRPRKIDKLAYRYIPEWCELEVQGVRV